MKLHKHAEVIKAWADGQKIEVLSITDGWVEPVSPQWSRWDQYRIKPEPAAPKWPKTTMTQNELWSQIDNVRNAPALEVFANMVIARACEEGALVPADKVREIEAKARAEGIMEGRSKEQELLRQQVDFGAGYGRAVYCGAQAFSPSIFEIQRMQHADAVARGHIK